MSSAKPTAPPPVRTTRVSVEVKRHLQEAIRNRPSPAANGAPRVDAAPRNGDAGKGNPPVATGKRKAQAAENTRQQPVDIETINEGNSQATQPNEGQAATQGHWISRKRQARSREPLALSSDSDTQMSDEASCADPSEPPQSIAPTSQAAAPQPQAAVARAPQNAALPPAPIPRERFPPAYKTSAPIVIDVKLEEMFSPIILKHAPRFRDTRPRTLVWEAIVDDSRGRYVDPLGAQIRTLWLCRIAANPSHVLYNQISPLLRTMLLEIFDHWKAGLQDESMRQGRLAQSEKANPQAETIVIDDSEDERDAENEPPVKQLPTPRVQTKESTVQPSELTVRPKESPVQPKESPAKPARTREEESSAKLDAHAMKVLLKHSPAFLKGRSKMLVYQAIADDSHGRYKSALGVKSSVAWMCKVASSPSDPRYHTITPKAREMLLTFREHMKGMAVDESTDERLMELVLELCPVAASKSELLSIGSDIAKRLQSPLVDDALDVSRRVKFLEDIYDKPSHPQHGKLTKKLLVQLGKYTQALVGPQSAMAKKVPSTPDPSSSTTAVQAQRLEVSEATASLTDDMVDHEPPSPSGGKTDDEDQSDQQPAEISVVATRAPPSTSTGPHAQGDASLEVCTPPSSPTVTQAEDEVPVETSSPPCTSTGTQTEAEVSVKTISLPTNGEAAEAPSLVALLTTQVARLEKEQRELREELRAQRESHHREATATTELMERERQDRKQEFATLMAVISRLVGAPQTAAPATASASDPKCLL